MAKRNPPIRWAEPIQGQGARQQARFLLEIERAMAADQRFSAEHSLVLNTETRAVLEAAGVRLELLHNPGETGYAKEIDAALKAPWVEAKGNPLLRQLNATKDSVGRCFASAGSLDYLEQGSSTALLTEAALSQHGAELLARWEPRLQLNWRHQIHYIAAAVLEQGLVAAGLKFDADSLAELQQLADQTQAVIQGRREEFVAQRKAEFKDRFGHQPTAGKSDGSTDEAMFIATGKTLREVMEEIFGTGSRATMRDVPALPTDWTTLGLNPGATATEIKSAYRALAMQHHPDQGGEQEQFIAITKACERLLAGAQR